MLIKTLLLCKRSSTEVNSTCSPQSIKMQTPINTHCVAGSIQLPKGRVMMTALVWSGVGYHSISNSHVGFGLCNKQKLMLSAPNVTRSLKTGLHTRLRHMSVGN